MARDEYQREDLLREATALVERAEFVIAAIAEPVVIGFRREGAGSIFFGEDPAYHFTTAGQLRRAFVAGRLYKAERGQLVQLDRVRTPAEVQLVRHELDSTESSQFLSDMTKRLETVLAALRQGDFRIAGRVPDDWQAAERACEWLEDLVTSPAIAPSPRVA